MPSQIKAMAAVLLLALARILDILPLQLLSSLVEVDLHTPEAKHHQLKDGANALNLVVLLLTKVDCDEMLLVKSSSCRVPF
jgi:hypothetical protein